MPPLQAEAKAAAEQQARLRAEEEARKAAQQKLAAAQARAAPAHAARGQPGVRVSACHAFHCHPGNTSVFHSLMSVVLAAMLHIFDTTSSSDAGLSDVNILQASLQATSVDMLQSFQTCPFGVGN